MDLNIPAFRHGLPSRCLVMDVLSDLTPLFQLSDNMLQYKVDLPVPFMHFVAKGTFPEWVA
jgi:hypothetical protein